MDTLGRKVRVEVTGASQELPPPATGLTDSVEERALAIGFKPDGTAEPLELLLSDEEGFVFSLRINPITSRVTVFNEGRQPL